MAKHFKTPEGDAGRESTGRFEPLPTQATAPHRRSWDDEADVTASGPAAGGDGYGFDGGYGYDPQSQEPVRRVGKRRRHCGRTVGIVVGVLLVALLAVGGVCGFALYSQAKSVKDQAKTAMSLASSAVDSVKEGDFASVSSDLRELDALCANINDQISGPLWTVASFVPVYGGDVSAARTLAGALSDVSESALLPLADALQNVTPGKLLSDGTVNVSALQAVADTFSEAAPAVQAANQNVQAIGPTSMSEVSDLVSKAKGGFSALAGAVDTAKGVAPVLPQMLGAEGQTRNYLVVAENNVEIRANGGYGGSQGVISVTDGKLEIGDFQPKMSLGIENALPVTEEEEVLFNQATHEMGSDSGDTLFTPDFPRAAGLLSQMWEIKYGQHLDGVVALDPVFLQYLLGVVGGVELPDGSSIDGTNAARVLMHDVYWNYDPSQQDAIFAAAAGAAFDKVLGGLGSADLAQLSAAVQRGCEEGRFIAWMENPDEENVIKELGLAAALPDASDTSTAPVAGVFVNNIRGSKLDWFLNKDVTVGTGKRNSDGSWSYPVTVTLSSVMSEKEEASLPLYVAGIGRQASDWNDERLTVLLYAPAGGTISDVVTSGSAAFSTAPEEHAHNGLQMFYGVLELLPRTDATVTYTVTTAAAAGDQPLTVRTTPTCQAAR